MRYLSYAGPRLIRKEGKKKMSCVPWKTVCFNRDSMGSHPKVALTGQVTLSKSVTHCKIQASSLITGSDNLIYVKCLMHSGLFKKCELF